MQQWHVMFTNPKKEASVSGQFLDRGIKTYFPYLQLERGYGRGILVEPYFPNYVFFYEDLLSPRAYDLQYMPGVRGVVSFDDQPATVPEEMMTELQDHLQPLENRVLKKTEWLFKPGDRVLLTNGPFASFEAIFERFKSSQERAQILLKVLGTVTRTEIDVRDLKAVGTASKVGFPI